MNETTAMPQPAAEPVLAIYPDGRITFGAGYTVADLLRALELAQQAVMSVTPRPRRTAAEAREG